MFSAYTMACGVGGAIVYIHEIIPRPLQQGDPGGSELSQTILLCFVCFIPLTAVDIDTAPLVLMHIHTHKS